MSSGPALYLGLSCGNLFVLLMWFIVSLYHYLSGTKQMTSISIDPILVAGVELRLPPNTISSFEEPRVRDEPSLAASGSTPAWRGKNVLTNSLWWRPLIPWRLCLANRWRLVKQTPCFHSSSVITTTSALNDEWSKTFQILTNSWDTFGRTISCQTSDESFVVASINKSISGKWRLVSNYRLLRLWMM